MAAIELDILAARNRHAEVIDRPNAVHLFSDNWPVRRWASAWVAEQKTASQPSSIFDELETISLDAVSDRLATVSLKVPTNGQAVGLGKIKRAEIEAPESLLPHVERLAAAYIKLDRFAVPYLDLAD